MCFFLAILVARWLFCMHGIRSLYDGHSLHVSTAQTYVVNAFSFPMFQKYFAIQYSLICKAFNVSFLANSSTGPDMQFRLRICYFIYFRKILENVRNSELKVLECKSIVGMYWITFCGSLQLQILCRTEQLFARLSYLLWCIGKSPNSVKTIWWIQFRRYHEFTCVYKALKWFLVKECFRISSVSLQFDLESTFVSGNILLLPHSLILFHLLE